VLLARDEYGEKPIFDYHRIRGSVLKDGNLFAFARTLGCTDVGQAAFAKMAQEKYTAIVNTDSTAVDLMTNVKREMQSDPTVALTCGNSA